MYKIGGHSLSGDGFALEKNGEYIFFRPTVKVKVDAKGKEKSGEDDGEDDGKQEAKPIQSNIASLLPTHAWTGPATSLMWNVRWNTNGLIPVRPILVLPVAGKLEPGESIEL